jgi:hypothetical protein
MSSSTLKTTTLSFSQFVPVQATNAYAGVEVQLHSLLTSALDGDVWSTSRSIRFDPKEIAPGTVGTRADPEKNVVQLVDKSLSTSFVCVSLYRVTSQDIVTFIATLVEASHLAK